MIPNDRIAAACRALRAMRGWKQKDLGELMGVTAQTVRAIESGRGNGSRHVVNIADATGVTLGQFDVIMDIVESSSRRIASD